MLNKKIILFICLISLVTSDPIVINDNTVGQNHDIAAAGFLFGKSTLEEQFQEKSEEKE